MKNTMSPKQATKLRAKLKQNMLKKRTKEHLLHLNQALTEKMGQMERFVEFGKLASSLFHDLATPLTALSLSLREIKSRNGPSTKESEKYLNQAIALSRKIEVILVNGRRQLQSDDLNNRQKNLKLLLKIK